MMMSLLTDIVIIFGLSSLVLLICHRVHIPPVVGFLLTGILAGPHGLGAVTGVHEVEVMAEIGVVLLLFTIGLEFSLDHLSSLKKYALLGGSIQVVITILAVWGILTQMGLPLEQAIFLGLLISLSSTAIVLKVLQDRAEINMAHGQVVLAILIFQDIIIVPMMLFTPFLAGNTGNVTEDLILLLVKGIGTVAFVLISARYLAPFLLYQIAQTRSRELFVLAVVLICLAVAWLTSFIGLSLALGAFLAGLIISESEYSHQAMSHILPFRDIFTSFFFISIGMLLDTSILIEQPGAVVLLTLGVLVIKALIAGMATLASGGALRVSVLTGLALCQVGEFSFILSKTGLEYNLLTDATYQLFLAVCIVSMTLSPFIISLSSYVADQVVRLPIPLRFKASFAQGAVQVDGMPESYVDNHLIIVGYGINGRNVARAARIAMVPYVVIEMNPETVRVERERGEPIMYGDASREAVLEAARIDRAHILVAAVADAAATRAVTAEARRLNPNIHIIARTRFVREVEPLYQLGANEVIPEEFETSVEIFTRVLVKYGISITDIESFISEVRSDGYGLFRNMASLSGSEQDLKFFLPDLEISAVELEADSPFIGQTLAETDMRAAYQVTVVSIQRDDAAISNPDGNEMLQVGDTLVLMGKLDAIRKVALQCTGRSHSDE